MPNHPSAVSLLILSDIHFGSLSESPDFALEQTNPRKWITDAVSMKDSLISTVKKRHGQIDCVLVPGDLTSTARPAEFVGCKNVVDEIVVALGVDTEKVIYTFGNHDVDWTISKMAAGENADCLYESIAGHVGSIFVKNPTTITAGPLPGSGVFRPTDSLKVISLNTGYYCNSSQSYAHGKLGNVQLEWFREQCNVATSQERWTVLMLHHHPHAYSYPIPGPDISNLEEGDHLLDIIGKSRIDLICHGHRHQAKLFTRFESGWHSPKTFLCAGSVAVDCSHRANGSFDNLFHIATLEYRKGECAMGRIETFAYSIHKGWRPHEFNDHVPLDGVQFFGSLSTEKDRSELVRSMLEISLKETAETVVPLPDYGRLDHALRCSTCYDVNKLLQQIVEEHADLRKVIGRYPEDVAVARKTK